MRDATKKPLTKQDLKELKAILEPYIVPQTMSCKDTQFFLQDYLWCPDKKRVIGGIYAPAPPAKGIIWFEQEEEYKQ